MEVVGHRTGGWYLLRAEGRHYLDVNCHLPLVEGEPAARARAAIARFAGR